MSSLGYIQNSYGKSINIAVANTYSYNVLSSGNLPDNTIIISSPLDENNDDRGIFSVSMTDSSGQPVRLTYTLQEGPGMRYSNDSIKVEIDDFTIVENNKELLANVDNLIDNDTIYYNDKIKLNVNNLDKANKNISGVFKIDDDTVKIADDKLYVNTSNLKYANSDTNIPGIFIGDDKYITVNQGVISINQDMIDKANKESFGIVRGNNSTISINNGQINVITENLNKSDKDNAGIIMPDNKTIVLNENDELKVDISNLNKTSNIKAGVFKYDPNTFILDKEILKVKEYGKFNTLMESIDNTEVELKKDIEDIKYLLSQYKVKKNKPEIIDFHATRLLTSILDRPLYLDQPVDEMGLNFVSTEFIIATNCPFKISMAYENNIDPPITLYSINYNNTHIFAGNSGLNEIFQTTEERQVPIKFTFLARNYYKNDKNEYTKKVKITITVSYSEDVTINKSIMYSIVRFNSGYNEEIEYKELSI